MHIQWLSAQPPGKLCWCGWYAAEECPKTSPTCQGALNERLKEANRYRWLVDSASIANYGGSDRIIFETDIPVKPEIGAHRWRINKAIDAAIADYIRRRDCLPADPSFAESDAPSISDSPSQEQK